MQQVNCISCQTPTVADANYCYHCGQLLKCKSCQEYLVAGAYHCIACGTAVNDAPITPFLNSIRFKENKEERSYELAFTNDVGKEIKEVVADLLKNKLGQPTGPTLSIQNLQEDQIHFSEPVDTFNTGQEPSENISKRKDEIITSEEYPHIDDLEIHLHCRENEWLLIYAFYTSEYGKTLFSKTTVWDLYKKKRNTETRFKNLGTNWKSLFKKYISTVRENEFKFTPLGLEKVHQLLKGQEQEKRVNKLKKRRVVNPDLIVSAHHSPISLTPRKVVANSIMQEEFDAYKNSYKDSLENFFKMKNPGTSTPNRLVAMGYYITKINGQDYFTEGHIDFAFRLLNLSGKPIHLTQVITNLKNERVWFQRVKQGDISGWRLTRQAEIYVEEKLPPKQNLD